MWNENKIILEDLRQLCEAEFIPWEMLRGASVLVTGATGLIGHTLTSALLYANEVRNLGLRVVAPVRSVAKAESRFAAQLAAGCPLSLIEGSVEDLPEITGPVDYVIHAAAPTASRFYVEHPLETIDIVATGTKNLLELARGKNAKGFVFLSSMEVYGASHTDEPILEERGAAFDTMAVRSCYPEAKRLSEALCAAYASEYGVPAKVIRLAQTLGPGIAPEDGRVCAQFARSVLNGEDIVLNTPGTSKQSRLYTADAISAILCVLLCGEQGKAYNAANPEMYGSVKDMAELVAHTIAKDKIVVTYNSDENAAGLYPPAHSVNLSAERLKALGWKPSRNLARSYERMLRAMEG